MADESQMADAPSNFGDVIKQKLAESVQDMDIVSMLQNIVAVTPEDAESEEIRQKLQGVLEKYNDMIESDKELFVSQMKDLLATKISNNFNPGNVNLDGLQEAIGQAILYRLAFLAIGVLFLIILFGMFYVSSFQKGLQFGYCIRFPIQMVSNRRFWPYGRIASTHSGFIRGD